MAPTVISLEVTTDHAVPVEPSLGGSVSVLNVSGDTLYYADNPQVSPSNNQGTLTAGQSATFSPPQWLKSAGLSTVTVTVNDGATSSSGIGVPAVALTGTPTSGQVPTATGGATATWQTPSAGGSGGSITVQGSQGTNLGATQTINFASTVGETWLVGTLNANLAVTIQNQVAGCRAMLLLVQDSTGGRTLTVNGTAVTIPATAGAFTAVEIKCPDGTNQDVAVLGGGTNLGPSWVDMCAAPYNCRPGTDITIALQTAINAANTANQDTTLYFSIPGTYNINGAQQTGSGTISGINYTYSGQVVFPARLQASGQITIRIMGTNPVSNFHDGPIAAGGVTLQSNATSGSVFDAIPATAFSPNAFTWIVARLENIHITTPATATCNGFDGYNLLGLATAGSCLITANGGTPTGSTFAIRFPAYNNGGTARVSGDLECVSYPVGVVHSEHFTADLLFLQTCLTGVQPNGSGGVGHPVQYRRLVAQACQYVIQPAGSAQIQIRGALDVLDGASPACTDVIHDPSNLLYGELVVGQWAQTSAPGFPVTGGVNLKLVPHNGNPSRWPSDDFIRNSSGNVASSAYIGASSNTHHIWNAIIGAFTTAGGVLKSTNGSGASEAELIYNVGKAGRSRTIRLIVTTGTTGYYAFANISKVIAGTNVNNRLSLGLTGGLVQLGKTVSGTFTPIAQSAAASVTTSTQYTIDIVISNPNSGSYTVQVFLNGTSILTVAGSGTGTLSGGVYTLGTAEVAALVDTDQLRTKDSLGFNSSDITSSFSLYRVSAN